MHHFTVVGMYDVDSGLIPPFCNLIRLYFEVGLGSHFTINVTYSEGVKGWRID